jgi:GT2 family glycosyltransferase
MTPDVSIVIPVHNQLDYTKSCLESLRTSADGAEIIVVDNGSSDGTAEYLASQGGITVIRNAENRGCAPAWNQGVEASRGERVVILNNDVIVTPGWLGGLVSFSEQERLDIVSPAIREGEVKYEVERYGREFVSRMGDIARMGVADGICFMVRRRVFDAVGAFDENFRIGQFEDADFFRRAAAAGFRLGTTGRSFIHHFGSVTQDALRGTKTGRPYEAENREYYRRKWNLTWPRRFFERRRAKLRNLFWRVGERALRGHTLKERWDGGRLRHY